MFLLLVLIIVAICFRTQSVFKEYAISEVEETWAKELRQPGAMDSIQQIVSKQLVLALRHLHFNTFTLNILVVRLLRQEFCR